MSAPETAPATEQPTQPDEVDKPRFYAAEYYSVLHLAYTVLDIAAALHKVEQAQRLMQAELTIMHGAQERLLQHKGLMPNKNEKNRQLMFAAYTVMLIALAVLLSFSVYLLSVSPRHL
ncbi:hypothetical protein F5Y18DRAFT_433156 [Xylariaceae sp. FL1019]|nr:hypothetical protein F5Y18DRAFT_433156 [Xylariaceae sp. FL1019]